MSVVTNIDVVMGAKTAELDAAVAKEIQNMDKLKTAANTQVDVKGFKDMGKSTKSIAEFSGVLGTLAGSSELGQIGQLIGNITEKTSQFSEVAGKGAAGAFAFKAGLVALTAYGSFQVGKMIGEWVFDTQRWNEELEASRKRFEEIGEASRKLSMDRFKDEQKDTALIRDPKAKQAKQQEDLALEVTNFKALQARREAILKDRGNMKQGMFQSGMDFGQQQNNATLQANAIAKEMELSNEKQKMLWAELDPRNAQLELNKKLDAIEEKSKATRQSAVDDYVKIQQKLVEITQGKEAALKMDLEAKGYNEEEVQRLLKAQAKADEAQKTQEKAKKDQEELKRLKEGALSADDQLLARAKELQLLKNAGMISQSQYDKEIKKSEASTREDTPEYRGAVSAQKGSVEAYKLMLERERGLINETQKQTVGIDRIAAAMDVLNRNVQNLQPIGLAR